MKNRPITLSGHDVRAILDGRKTQARRLVKPQSAILTDELARYFGLRPPEKENQPVIKCPLGDIGDKIWVREAFSPVYPQDPHYNNGNPIEYDYKATYTHGDRLGDYIGIKKVWKPSIHMPREASRITLEVTGVRVEQLRETTEADARAEGFGGVDPIGNFADWWNKKHGPLTWAKNPWVWVIEFRRVET